MLTGSILILVMLLIYCLYRRLRQYRYRHVGWCRREIETETTACMQ